MYENIFTFLDKTIGDLTDMLQEEQYETSYLRERIVSLQNQVKILEKEWDGPSPEEIELKRDTIKRVVLEEKPK